MMPRQKLPMPALHSYSLNRSREQNNQRLEVETRKRKVLTPPWGRQGALL